MNLLIFKSKMKKQLFTTACAKAIIADNAYTDDETMDLFLQPFTVQRVQITCMWCNIIYHNDRR
jgi:alpha-D-ribose 1-methylphosphonate 5-phosphate C-P lyase